jgi:hypothetical protein
MDGEAKFAVSIFRLKRCEEALFYGFYQFEGIVCKMLRAIRLRGVFHSG